MHLRSDDQLIKLLELQILTEALLQKEYTPEWFITWVPENIDVDDYVGPIEWQACLQGKWHAVPVFLVHERAYLRYFILGLVYVPDGPSLWPEWTDQLMDESTKKGIASAVKACKDIHPLNANRKFTCYPLTVPNRNTQFKHTSLGLPLSLGVMKLVTGENAFEGLAASGSVQEDGSVGGIGQLSKKMAHAEKMGFTGILFPADNPALSVPGDIELFPVSDLSEAWMFATLYAPGRTGALLLMSNMLKDPYTFVNNCTSVPLDWVLWARQNGRTYHVMDLILNSPNLFEAFVEKLGSCLDKGKLVQGEALAELMDLESVKELTDAAPLSVFKWFSLNLSIANHRGDVILSEVWGKEANRMVSRASVSDAVAFAAFYNHRFIALHHNRYHFTPELPDFVKIILNSLEAQHRSQRRLLKNATDETLGALYGSIAQNYGFCGPQYMEETRKYSLLSREAFGKGKVPELKDHWLRQLNYLTYAYLDTGDLDAAEKTLLAYTEIETWQELWSKLPGLSQWHHALLARFFADSEERQETLKYADWSLRNKDRILSQEHPWQLWLYNMGRVSYSLGDTKEASELYSDSLALCLSGKLGPTVQMMALLPLSGLSVNGCLLRSQIDPVEKRIRKSGEGLNPNYFRLLLDESDFTRTLEKIWTQPEALFPFTYR